MSLLPVNADTLTEKIFLANKPFSHKQKNHLLSSKKIIIFSDKKTFRLWFVKFVNPNQQQYQCQNS